VQPDSIALKYNAPVPAAVDTSPPAIICGGTTEDVLMPMHGMLLHPSLVILLRK